MNSSLRHINIKESQSLLLDMADKAKHIAECHNIPLFMVGGTMLGAIRHKGFIPWDDDMDFGVTYDSFWKLTDILKKELPSRYKCITYEDDDEYKGFYFKVVDTYTCIDDPHYNIPLEQKRGLSIDVFPIVSCNEEEGRQKTKQVYNEWMTLRKIYIRSRQSNWIKQLTKTILKTFATKKPIDYLRRIREIIDSITPGDKYCNIVSPQFWKIIWDKPIFDDLQYYHFEDAEFLGPKNYDTYLSTLYKNYMQLPPEGKRRVHANATYLIE